MPVSAQTKRKGFTLIELMITISIIAVLSAIGLTVFSSAIRQGRDSKRQSDMRAIQSALEQYYADQGFYPCAGICGASTLGLSEAISAASSDRTAFQAFTNAIGNPVALTSLKTYMNALPFDPDPETSSPWTYAYEGKPSTPTPCDNSTTNKCTGYCLYARLENTDTRIGAGTSVCDRSGYDQGIAVTPP